MLPSSIFKLKTLFIIGVIVCFTQYTTAQDTPDTDVLESKSKFWENVQFGGGIGLTFADDYFAATLAPQAIYRFNPIVGLGIGLNGTINNQSNAFNSTILGGSIISTINIIDSIQLSAEFEELNVQTKFKGSLDDIPNDNFWTEALFIGAGFRTGNMVFGARFNILHDDDRSVYRDAWAPFVRVFF